ncbi:MAG: hypothetical protein AB1568_05595 [Thermodesulfobacteriota bacterium]
MSRTGYVKLHRRLLDSQVFQNEGLLKVWLWCLMKANYGESWATITTGRGSSEVKVGVGQFLYGRLSAAKELRMPAETVRRRIDKLKNLGNLTMQSTSHYSIVTVCNWDVYQGRDVGDAPAKAPAVHQPCTTSEEEKRKKPLLTEVDGRFDAFWGAYPRRVGKAAAVRAWVRLSPGGALFAEIMTALAAAKDSDQWQRDEGRFVPHPATWLNGRRWEDEQPGPAAGINGATPPHAGQTADDAVAATKRYLDELRGFRA